MQSTKYPCLLRISGVEYPRRRQQHHGLWFPNAVDHWCIPPVLWVWDCLPGNMLSQCLCTATFDGLGFSCCAGALRTSWQTVRLHAGDMSYPLEFGLNEHGLNAWGVSMIQDLKIDKVLLPVNSEYATEGSHVNVLQLSNLSHSKVSKIQNNMEGRVITLQICCQPNIMLTEHSVAKSS